MIHDGNKSKEHFDKWATVVSHLRLYCPQPTPFATFPVVVKRYRTEKVRERERDTETARATQVNALRNRIRLPASPPLARCVAGLLDVVEICGRD